MKVSDAAATYASRFGVDLKSLTDDEARALDVGGSGEVTEADARAVIQLFHGGFEGPLTDEERQRLKAFADGDVRWQDRPTRADYLHQHLAERADAFVVQADVAHGDAWSRYQAARAVAPPANPAPTEVLRGRLADVRASLQTFPQREAAFAQATHDVTAAQAQLTSAQKALDRAQAKLRTLQKRVGRDTPEALQGLIEEREKVIPDEKETLAKLKTRLADALGARSQQAQVAALEGPVGQAVAAFAAARARVPPEPPALSSLQAQKETLERELRLRDAADLYTGTQMQWQVAHGLAVRAHAVEQEPVEASLREGFDALVLAETDAAQHEEQAGRLARVMGGPVALQALLDAGKLKRGDIQTEFLSRQLGEMQGMMDDHVAAIDRDARSMADELSDPVFQESLAREPENVRAEVVRRMVAVLSKSQEGKAYFERDIRPALEGRPGASAFWRGLLVVDKTEKRVQTSTKAAFTVLNALGGLIASQKDASALLDSSLRTALALSGDKGVSELQAAVLKYKSIKDALGDKPTPAELAQAKEKFRAAVEGTPLARLANSIDTLSDSLTALGGAISVAEAFRDPSLKSTLQAIRGTADMTQAGANFASRIVAQGGKWATFSKAAGSLGSVAGGVLADMDRRSAEKRGDIGGTVGASFSETGSAVAATGLALDATGIGAAIGVPLNAIGGGLNAVGATISFFFQDSDTTKWLRENDLLMYSSHSSYATQRP